MLALAATSTSTRSLTASLSTLDNGARTSGQAAGGGGGGRTRAAVEISISHSRSASVEVSTAGPRQTLGGALKSLDTSLDRLLAEPETALTDQKDEKLDRLQFLLDSLQMILKDRDLSSSDKTAMLGYLANVAGGKEPTDAAKAAFGEAMSAVADRAGLSAERASDYRDLLGRFAALPEGSEGTPGGGSASVSRLESLSVSIKGAFEVVTAEGTMTAAFEFTQDMVVGFSAAVGEGEASIAEIQASRTSFSFSLGAAAYAAPGAPRDASVQRAA